MGALADGEGQLLSARALTLHVEGSRFNSQVGLGELPVSVGNTELDELMA